MNNSNKKRIPITDKYIDNEGNEKQRASSSDFESLSLRHIYVLNTVIHDFDKENELLEKLEAAENEYDKGYYEEALKYLNWALIKKPSLEQYIFYYIKI